MTTKEELNELQRRQKEKREQERIDQEAKKIKLELEKGTLKGMIKQGLKKLLR